MASYHLNHSSHLIKPNPPTKNTVTGPRFQGQPPRKGSRHMATWRKRKFRVLITARCLDGRFFPIPQNPTNKNTNLDIDSLSQLFSPKKQIGKNDAFFFMLVSFSKRLSWIPKVFPKHIKLLVCTMIFILSCDWLSSPEWKYKNAGLPLFQQSPGWQWIFL